MLKLRVSDINLDDLLVTLDGKGSKQRVVPFSFELRKAIHRYLQDFNRKPEACCSQHRTETALHRRNVLRYVKRLCLALDSRHQHARSMQPGTHSQRICGGADPSSICKR